MKILWFTNISLSNSNSGHNQPMGGSWMAALENELHKIDTVQLGVAYRSNVESVFENNYGKISNFEIPRNSGLRKIGGVRNQYYMDNERALRDYLKVVEIFQPDIIHIFGSENNFGLIIPHIEIPVVIHIQGVITVIVEKYFSNGFTKEDIHKHTSLKHRITNGGVLLDYKVLKKRSYVEKVCLKECRYVMGRTDWDRRVMAVLAPKAQYFHCDEMIRAEFLAEQWRPTGNSRLKLVSIIRNSSYKGMETVLETCKILKSFDIDFDWSIIGCVHHDLINTTLSKIHGLNLKDFNLKFLGNCSAEQIIEAFSKSDIFINSSHIENSPNSVCEAMLFGMPIIATYAGGTGSILKDGSEGILVQDGDFYVLAGAIIELSRNVKKQELYSFNARKRARVRHDKREIVNTLLDVYKSIIELDKK